MSLYLQRLLDMAAPAATLAGPTATPPAFLSQSPVFEADQRLDLFPQASLPLPQSAPPDEAAPASLAEAPPRPAVKRAAPPESETTSAAPARGTQEPHIVAQSRPEDPAPPSPDFQPEAPVTQPPPPESNSLRQRSAERKAPPEQAVPTERAATSDPLDQPPLRPEQDRSGDVPAFEPTESTPAPRPEAPAEPAWSPLGLFDGGSFRLVPELADRSARKAEQGSSSAMPDTEVPAPSPQQAVPAQDLAASPLVHQPFPLPPEPAEAAPAAGEEPQPPREIVTRVEEPIAETPRPKQPRTAAEVSVIGPLRQRRINPRLFRLGRY